MSKVSHKNVIQRLNKPPYLTVKLGTSSALEPQPDEQRQSQKRNSTLQQTSVEEHDHKNVIRRFSKPSRLTVKPGIFIALDPRPGYHNY